MDEQGRKAARTRATIAFALAGVLLVLNVVAGIAWREERRDRFERARIEFDQRTDGRRGGAGPHRIGPMGPGDQVPGRGQYPGRSGQDDQGDQERPGGRQDQDGSTRPETDPGTTDQEQPQEGTS